MGMIDADIQGDKLKGGKVKPHIMGVPLAACSMRLYLTSGHQETGCSTGIRHIETALRGSAGVGCRIQRRAGSGDLSNDRPLDPSQVCVVRNRATSLCSDATGF